MERLEEIARHLEHARKLLDDAVTDELAQIKSSKAADEKDRKRRWLSVQQLQRARQMTTDAVMIVEV